MTTADVLAGARGATAPTTVPFTALEEAMFNLDQAAPRHPWGVHVEAAVAGRLDADRLVHAVRTAADRHPMARARRVPGELTDRIEHWEIAPSLDVVPLSEIWAQGSEVTVERDRFAGRPVPLTESPPFRVLLLRTDEGDRIVVNAHHAASDGIGAARLLQSILRAYNGEHDACPNVDPLASRDLRARLRSAPLLERARHVQALVASARDSLELPARIAPDGGTGQGYGFCLLRVPDELAERHARRPAGVTVNDVLLAALHLGVARWNAEHRQPTSRIGVMMPVNGRPPEWWREVVGNYALFTSISSTASDRVAPERLLEAVAAQTRRVKRDGTGDALLEVLDRHESLPVGVKRLMPRLLPLTGHRMVDTAVLSNLGRVPDRHAVDGAGEVTELWFSPPARLPLAVAVGAVTYRGRWHLTLRYCRERLDAGAASRFGDALLAALDELAPR